MPVWRRASRTNSSRPSRAPADAGAQEAIDDFLARIDAYAEARDYPAPVVDHAVQRERALARYRNARP